MKDAIERIDAGDILLRPWQDGDEEALVRHANNRNVWRNLRDRFPHPYTMADAADWIGKERQERGAPMNLAIVHDSEAIGAIGLERQTDVYCKTAEVGYWLAQELWGRGFATATLGRFSEYAFASFDFERLQACVFSTNPASARVLEKCGYRFEGRLRASVFKDGRLLDSLLYARLRSDVVPV